MSIYGIETPIYTVIIKQITDITEGYGGEVEKEDMHDFNVSVSAVLEIWDGIINHLELTDKEHKNLKEEIEFIRHINTEAKRME